MRGEGDKTVKITRAAAATFRCSQQASVRKLNDPAAERVSFRIPIDSHRDRYALSVHLENRCTVVLPAIFPASPSGAVDGPSLCNERRADCAGTGRRQVFTVH